MINTKSRNGGLNLRTKRSSRQTPLTWILVCFLCSLLSFYGGMFVGWHSGKNMATADGESRSNNLRSNDNEVAALKSLVKDSASQIKELEKRQKELQEQIKNSKSNNESSPQQAPFHAEIFDTKHTGEFASGLEFVDRDDFATAFDTGVPLDESKKGNDRVLVLYSDEKAFPSKERTDGSLLSAEDATANCLNMHLVLTHQRKQQCIAVMGQYEAFHLYKFMRVEGEKGEIDPEIPLAIASRGHQQNGRVSAKLPSIEATKNSWSNLISYLQSLDTALEDLKPILEKVASHNDNNAVIVMVCNFGQSEILLNFICNARAKGLGDLLSNVFLFATDQATHDLAQSLGITSIYIESIFGGMPEKAANAYLDKNFRDMMLAKVYCIHLVSMLGHDILFQDVDVVWYQNPLAWFHDESNPHYNFDMYFQDDGNHGLFYAPYSANTGFYYVRNNDKTRYFFNSFLMAGDQIQSSGSHQIPLVAHLSEQASIHGLKVKVMGFKTREFPGGRNFHQRNFEGKKFMKEVMSGESKDTYIFHMSWTKSKINKIKFYQQMGEWYLNESCISKPASEIPKDCCLADPAVTCHYRDKPSKIPCKESDPIDDGARSWW